MSLLIRRRSLSLALFLLVGAPWGAAYAGYIFGPATSLISPSVNGDETPSLSSDNQTLYFASRLRGGSGSYDIFTATRPTPAGLFGPAVNLGSTVNSSSLDGSPQTSLDGLSLVFTSTRPGGLGGNDLWITTRATTHDAFGTPVNLGPGVNSSADDIGPNISADGLTLLFTRAADIYMATRPTTSVPFGAAVNLGSSINTSADEYFPSLSTDGLALFFNSDRAGGFGDLDLWVSTRASLAAPWGTPVNLGPNVNGPFTEETGDIAWDGSSIVFGSTRSGGAYRLYQALVVPGWSINANGNWSLAANWSGAVPNAIGASAIFGNVITAPRTVTLDAPQTVGSIKFDNANSYTIAGPAGLTLDNSGLATIAVVSGSHTISAPLSIAAGNSLTKTGFGTLTLSGPQSHAAGATLTVFAGTLNLNADGGTTLALVAGATTNLGATQHLAALTLGNGVGVNLAPGGKLIRTPSLSLAATSALDLADGKLIFDGDAGTRGARLAQITQAIGSGAAGLAWTGPGIRSSAAAADPNHLTALGVMLNDDGLGGAYHAMFGGETVNANSVLARYTYYGDADLSGAVDGTDYALIDNAFNGQTGPLGGLANVPEPSAWALAALASHGIAACRRRRPLTDQ